MKVRTKDPHAMLNQQVKAHPTMAEAGRGIGTHSALADRLDATQAGSGMNWDHYAQCRLQDFEQR